MKTALITGYTELNPLIPAMKNTYSWRQVIMGRKRIDREVVEKQCELCRSAFEVQIGTRSEFKRFCTGACAKKFNGQSNKGRKHTEASKHKISLSLTGERNPFYGKEHTKESLDKMSKSKSGVSWKSQMGEDASNERKENQSQNYSGEGNPFYGKKHSQESKIKIVNAHLKNEEWKGAKNPWHGKGFLRKGENNPSWNGGTSFEEYPETWTETLRTEIRTKDQFVCSICSSNGYDVHHIDYNKKNCDASNLITLCRSCHAKTNFNREAWKSYFSALRGA